MTSTSTKCGSGARASETTTKASNALPLVWNGMMLLRRSRKGHLSCPPTPGCPRLTSGSEERWEAQKRMETPSWFVPGWRPKAWMGLPRTKSGERRDCEKNEKTWNWQWSSKADHTPVELTSRTGTGTPTTYTDKRRKSNREGDTDGEMLSKVADKTLKHQDKGTVWCTLEEVHT